MKIHGDKIAFLLPYFSLVEKLKFFGYADMSCIRGFEASEAAVFLIHSSDDGRVSYKENFERFYQLFSKDPRFVFLSLSGKGHSYVYHSEASESYRQSLEKEYRRHLAEEGREDSPKNRREYMAEHMEKQRFFELDEEIMRRMVEFYEASLSREQER